MDSEYLYRAIAQFIRAQDFRLFLFTCAIARDRVFARDFAIVRDVSKLNYAPRVIARILVKRCACINSLLARLLPEHRASNSGIKNACAHGHLELAKWFMQHSCDKAAKERAIFALKGAYRGGHRAIIDYICAIISEKTLANVQNTICYNAMHGNHPELVDWEDLKNGDRLSYGIAGAINGGHEELFARLKKLRPPGMSWNILFLTWAHYLKQDNQQAIAEHLKVTNGQILEKRAAYVELLCFASPSMLHMILSLYASKWILRGCAWLCEFVGLCEWGNFERVQLIYGIFYEHGIAIPKGIIESAICCEHHNLNITAFLFAQLAKYSPMGKNEWKYFLMSAVVNAGFTEFQYIVEHAALLNQTISLSRWRALKKLVCTKEKQDYMSSI